MVSLNSNGISALFNHDRCNRLDSIHINTCFVHERRGSRSWANYIDYDICNWHCNIHTMHVGLPPSHRTSNHTSSKSTFSTRQICKNKFYHHLQGGTISFLVPVLAILNLPQWKCPSADKMDAMSTEERTELWQLRMREISGAIAVSAIFQLVIGNLRLCCNRTISIQ